ncbi:MAG TPA: hypothetical protein VIX63_15950 [Vicinamibacterales bacterium]
MTQLGSALDNVIAQSERFPQNPLIFGVNHPLAHEAWIDRFSQQNQELFLDGLIEAGVHRVDINMGLFPWFDGPMIAGVSGDRGRAMATYDSLVQRIRARGLQLAINTQYSAVYHRMATVEEWADAAVRTYPIIAARYQPDTMIVVHEPTTMASRLGVSTTPQQWATFVDRTIRAVKAASPRTRTGVGGLHTEVDYLRAMTDVPNVEVMTIDIYEIGALPAYNDLITLGRSKGKAVYIEETWRTPYSTDSRLTVDQRGSAGIGLSMFQSLDAKWLRAIARWAGALNIEGVTPYWSQTFFRYVSEGGDGIDPVYNSIVMQAVSNGERTATFFAFRDLISSSVPPRRQEIESLDRDDWSGLAR